MSKYRDRGRIGSGGFGEVLLCERESDGFQFAKKRLLQTDPVSIKRFQREVRLLKKLSHANIVAVLATHLNAAPYWYVMPKYQCSLADLRSQLSGDRARIAKLFVAILEGMVYAHENGVIHRDLKPQNILINGDEDIVISDFGLGRDLDATTTRATWTGEYFGTLGYMAPEQHSSTKDADNRGDIFSLGQILYELLTNRFPGTVHDYSNVPPGLVSIIIRCTQYRPEDRFQKAADLLAAFRRWADGSRRVNVAESLRDLSERIQSSEHATAAEVKELGDLLRAGEGEEELLYDVAFGLPSSVCDALVRKDADAFSVLIRGFCARVASRSWGFDYTDSIAGVGKRLWEAARDPEVRAQLTVTVLNLGESHNRWYVLDVAASLIQCVERAEDVQALISALGKARYEFNGICSRLQVDKLHPLLRELAKASVE